MPLSEKFSKSLSQEVLDYCRSQEFDIEEDSYGATAFSENEEGNKVEVNIDLDNDTIIVEFGDDEDDRDDWGRKEFSGSDGDSLANVKRFML